MTLLYRRTFAPRIELAFNSYVQVEVDKEKNQWFYVNMCFYFIKSNLSYIFVCFVWFYADFAGPYIFTQEDSTTTT